ncbi:MAG: porin [Candidatus Bruticola sp.]
MNFRFLSTIFVVALSTACFFAPDGASAYPCDSHDEIVSASSSNPSDESSDQKPRQAIAALSNKTGSELESKNSESASKNGGRASQSAVGGKWKFGGKAELEFSNSKYPSIVNNERGSDMLMYETDKLMPKLEFNAKYTNESFLFYTKARYRFDKNKIELQDCYAHIPLGTKQKLVLGRFKTRFGIERSQSSSKVLTCNPSAVSEAMYLGRAWGASFEFESKRGDQLMLGLMNEHNNHRFTSSDNDLFARGRVRISDHAYLGASFLAGRHSFSEGHSLPVQRLGFDYQLKTDDLRIDSEIIYGHGYNGIQEVSSRSLGSYVGTAYTLDKNWDIVGFVDWFDPNLDLCNDSLYNDEINAALRYVVGVNYYLDRSKDRRIMFNYEWKSPTEGPKVSSNGIYMRWSYEF